MTAYRVIYDDGTSLVVMAHDIVEALRLGLLQSAATIKMVIHA